MSLCGFFHEGVSGGKATYQLHHTRCMVGHLDWQLTQLTESQRRHENEHRSREEHKDGLLKDEGEVEAIATGGVDDRAERSVCGGSAEGSGGYIHDRAQSIFT